MHVHKGLQIYSENVGSIVAVFSRKAMVNLVEDPKDRNTICGYPASKQMQSGHFFGLVVSRVKVQRSGQPVIGFGCQCGSPGK